MPCGVIHEPTSEQPILLRSRLRTLLLPNEYCRQTLLLSLWLLLHDWLSGHADIGTTAMTLPAILTQVGPYPVTYIPANAANIWQSDDGLPKEGVVCHIAEGTLAGCDSWFTNPAAQASANFCIGKGGEIHQYVPLFGKAPYANGVAKSETAKVAAMAPLVKALSEKYNWVSQNKWTWSVEHEGHSGDALTPAQFDASTQLVAMLLGSLPSERRRTFGHYQFDNITRAHCPGWDNATWRNFDSKWEELIQTPSPPPPPADDPLKAELDGVWDKVYEAQKNLTTATDHLTEVYRLLRERGIIPV